MTTVSLEPSVSPNVSFILVRTLIFGAMQIEAFQNIVVEQIALASAFLNRYVIVDVYLPRNVAAPSEINLLLINDGQDLAEMNFSNMLDGLLLSGQIAPLICAGIQAGKDRKNEYGTAKVLDYEGRGTKAEAYHQFVMQELLPFLSESYNVESFAKIGFCGFSLGGLTALNIVWTYPAVFSISGVFSGSLWWRSKALDDGYHEETDRIMHRLVKEGSFHPGQRFYFTTGSLDETADRNNNGIIDSIDDTLALMAALQEKGYTEKDISYTNFEDGKHDVVTWGRAMPDFLLWAWPVANTVSS
jgi:enterochelin esterase-like enzyme